jgi:hypothetical protein
MRLRLRRQRGTEEPSFFSVDTSPYADRLRLAEPFAADDETRPRAEDRSTYNPVLEWDMRCLGIRPDR